MSQVSLLAGPQGPEMDRDNEVKKIMYFRTSELCSAGFQSQTCSPSSMSRHAGCYLIIEPRNYWRSGADASAGLPQVINISYMSLHVNKCHNEIQ